MVNQAQMTHRGRNGNPVGSGADSPATAVGKNVVDFAHDLATLAELQAKLLAADLRQVRGRLVVPGVLAGTGAGLLLGALPLLPVAFALWLVFDVGWSFAPAFFVAAITGLVLGGGACFAAWLVVRRSAKALERSRDELVQNLKWIKDVLQRHRRAGDTCR